MSTVQLPTWLVIMFTVLALGAPSVAAWVQGKVVAARDDRRWASERDNEHAKYWRTERLRVYAGLAAALSKWRLALYEMETAVTTGGEVHANHIDRVTEGKRAAEDVFGELTLVASKDVYEAARAAMLDFTVDHDDFFANERHPNVTALLRSLDRVVTSMQEELDIPPLITRSPPSETAS